MENWYVIQTRVKEEEKLVSLIEKLIPPEKGLYRRCFVPKNENVWRLRGMNLTEIEVLFSGYVFVITDTPEKLFVELKSIPRLSKILGEISDDEGREFIPLSAQEQEFMENILDPSDYVVHRSIIHKNEKGRIDMAKGALEHYVDKIVKVDNTHRRILIDLEMFGRLRRIKFCFMNEEDCRLEGVEIPEWKKEPFPYEPGDMVEITSEAYRDQIFEIKKVDEKKRTITVEVDMFGMPVEMTVEENEICGKE